MAGAGAALKSKKEPVTRCIAGPSLGEPLETPEELCLDRHKSLFGSLALDLHETVATPFDEIDWSNAYQLAGANPSVSKEPHDHLVAFISASHPPSARLAPVKGRLARAAAA